MRNPVILILSLILLVSARLIVWADEDVYLPLVTMNGESSPDTTATTVPTVASTSSAETAIPTETSLPEPTAALPATAATTPATTPTAANSPEPETATPAVNATATDTVTATTTNMPTATNAPEPTAEVTPVMPTAHNVLLIVADDMGVEMLAGYGLGSDYPPTPNIDALFDQGVLFRNFWSAPTCSPTRATMLTGRYGFRTGVGSVVTGGNDSLQLSEFVLPEAIKTNLDAGYATANIGKWHVSRRTEAQDIPNQMGYDYYAGLLTGGLPDYFDWEKNVNGVTQQVTNYATTENVNDAIAWLEPQIETESPWFLWQAFNAPHTPFHKPPNDLHSFDSLSGTQADIDANPFPYYKAAIEAMDSEIGRLVNALPSDVRANTTIIFMGDNGTPRQVVQPPYERNHAKDTLYDGGINVPLVIAGPKVVAPGRESSALVNSADIYATVLALMGIDANAVTPAGVTLDSVSMLPYLENGEAESQREWIFSEMFEGTTQPDDGKAIRSERFKLIRYDDGTEEFYDLTADRLETSDLLSAGLTDDPENAYCALYQTMIDLLQSEPSTTVPTLPELCGSTVGGDITDAILTNRSANCADYAASYTASANDVGRDILFSSQLTIQVNDDNSCTFLSNAIPNHDFNDNESGPFPNNVSEQDQNVTIPANPQFAGSPTALSLRVNNAVLLNGVKVDLIAAGCFGVGNGRVGCNDMATPYRYDPMWENSFFRTDSHNAHSQPTGEYHYHGNPKALFDDTDDSALSPLIGFAADGFPIFGSFIDDNGTIRKAQSSYQLKAGTRPGAPSGPGGAYTGEFVDDYTYVEGSGDLDACNGMTVDGVYGYYVTDGYPHILGCFSGTPHESFQKGGRRR